MLHINILRYQCATIHTRVLYGYRVHIHIHTYVHTQTQSAVPTFSSSELFCRRTIGTRILYIRTNRIHIYIRVPSIATSPMVETPGSGPNFPRLTPSTYISRYSTRFHLASRRALTNSRSSRGTRLVLHVLCIFLPWRKHEIRHIVRLHKVQELPHPFPP